MSDKEFISKSIKNSNLITTKRQLFNGLRTRHTPVTPALRQTEAEGSQVQVLGNLPRPAPTQKQKSKTTTVTQEDCKFEASLSSSHPNFLKSKKSWSETSEVDA